MNTVWMIRNDGRVFPSVYHINANPEDVEETLFAAEWLYANTQHEESRQLVLETFAAWMASVLVDGNMTWNGMGEISREAYLFLSQEFVAEHEAEIKAIPTVELCLSDLCGEVVAELNQEFLRVSYGGMYQTDTASKELFFLISSIGFDWYKIICSFVTSVDFPIERIIITRDEEYKDSENKFYIGFPIETFLSGQPIKLTLKDKIKGGVMNREIFAHLSDGSSLRHISWDLAITTVELTDTLQIFLHEEKRRLMTFE